MNDYLYPKEGEVVIARQFTSKGERIVRGEVVKIRTLKNKVVMAFIKTPSGVKTVPISRKHTNFTILH